MRSLFSAVALVHVGLANHNSYVPAPVVPVDWATPAPVDPATPAPVDPATPAPVDPVWWGDEATPAEDPVWWGDEATPAPVPWWNRGEDTPAEEPATERSSSATVGDLFGNVSYQQNIECYFDENGCATNGPGKYKNFANCRFAFNGYGTLRVEKMDIPEWRWYGCSEDEYLRIGNEYKCGDYLVWNSWEVEVDGYEYMEFSSGYDRNREWDEGSTGFRVCMVPPPEPTPSPTPNPTEFCDETMYGVDGEGYRGCQSTTVEGFTCQRWDSQFPHSHSRTQDKYPHNGLVNNYCRNPDGQEGGIWCYTTNPDVRWDYCDPKAAVCAQSYCGMKGGKLKKAGEKFERGKTEDSCACKAMCTEAMRRRRLQGGWDLTPAPVDPWWDEEVAAVDPAAADPAAADPAAADPAAADDPWWDEEVAAVDPAAADPAAADPAAADDSEAGCFRSLGYNRQVTYANRNERINTYWGYSLGWCQDKCQSTWGCRSIMYGTACILNRDTIGPYTPTEYSSSYTSYYNECSAETEEAPAEAVPETTPAPVYTTPAPVDPWWGEEADAGEADAGEADENPADPCFDSLGYNRLVTYYNRNERIGTYYGYSLAWCQAKCKSTSGCRSIQYGSAGCALNRDSIGPYTSTDYSSSWTSYYNDCATETEEAPAEEVPETTPAPVYTTPAPVDPWWGEDPASDPAADPAAEDPAAADDPWWGEDPAAADPAAEDPAAAADDSWWGEDPAAADPAAVDPAADEPADEAPADETRSDDKSKMSWSFKPNQKGGMGTCFCYLGTKTQVARGNFIVGWEE